MKLARKGRILLEQDKVIANQTSVTFGSPSLISIGEHTSSSQLVAIKFRQFDPVWFEVKPLTNSLPKFVKIENPHKNFDLFIETEINDPDSNLKGWRVVKRQRNCKTKSTNNKLVEKKEDG